MVSEDDATSFARITLRIPVGLKAAMDRQTEKEGVSQNLFGATALAARLGADAEAALYFQRRGSRANLDSALSALDSLGTEITIPGDELPGDDEEEKIRLMNAVVYISKNDAGEVESIQVRDVSRDKNQSRVDKLKNDLRSYSEVSGAVSAGWPYGPGHNGLQGVFGVLCASGFASNDALALCLKQMSQVEGQEWAILMLKGITEQSDK